MRTFHTTGGEASVGFLLFRQENYAYTNLCATMRAEGDGADYLVCSFSGVIVLFLFLVAV